MALVPLIAWGLAGCASEEEQPSPIPGKTLVGETETGMKLTIETFADPAKDPQLKRLADWRVANRYPVVDFHRVTADNAAGQVPDNGRTVRFATDARAISAGKAVEARFSCDALQFEWLPLEPADNARWRQLRQDVCADGPPKPEGIPAGSRKVYYLITDRGFGERGIRRMRVYGPRDVEFKPGT